MKACRRGTPLAALTRPLARPGVLLLLVFSLPRGLLTKREQLPVCGAAHASGASDQPLDCCPPLESRNRARALIAPRVPHGEGEGLPLRPSDTDAGLAGTACFGRRGDGEPASLFEDAKAASPSDRPRCAWSPGSPGSPERSIGSAPSPEPSSGTHPPLYSTSLGPWAAAAAAANEPPARARFEVRYTCDLTASRTGTGRGSS